MEKETLGRGPKGGGKEKLGEEEWVSLNTLSLRKTKIWQDYSTSLELKRREEMEFLCPLVWMRGGVYIVVVEEISYLTKFWSELPHSCAQIETPDV